MTESVIREFHRLYYEHGTQGNYGRGLHAQTMWHGHEAHKCPLDLWVYQEILHEIRPGLVVELGTYLGGTTLFLAHQLELLGCGRVLSIDHQVLNRPIHERIEYILGKTTDELVLAQVSDAVQQTEAQPVLVIHDADHRYENVLADLESYAPFVTPQCYLIVEDTNVNGHPVLHGWGAGPHEAVEEFCRRHTNFVPDRSREKYLMTYNSGGYLRRQF